MLEKVCRHVHNYFTRAAYPGTYTITDGALALDFLKEGQRFHVVGSDLNDGVYTWHATGITNDDDNEAAQLKDETFNGSICAMAVPRAFIDLVGEVSAWQVTYGEKAASPFQSETVIGVYSYDKGYKSGSVNGAPMTWESEFSSRLQPYMRTGLLL